MSRHHAAMAMAMAILAFLPPARALGGDASAEAMPAAPPPAAGAAQHFDALLSASRRLEYTDSRQAFALATQALAQARNERAPRSELDALLQAGKTARFFNDYPQALRAANEGLALAEKLKSETMKGNFYLLLGM